MVDGKFTGIGITGHWWCANLEGLSNPFRYITFDSKSIGGQNIQDNGYSVRCIRD